MVGHRPSPGRSAMVAAALVACLSSALLSQTPRIEANDNRAPAGTLHDGVLALDLEVRAGSWHPEEEDGPSLQVQAFGEVGGAPQIPGPLIRVPEGTRIQATVHNRLADATLVVHGFHARPGSRGDTLQVAPGGRREVSFEAGAAGTYFYWATTTGRTLLAREDVDSQLSGAIVVDPRDAAATPDDRIFVLGVWLQPADSTGPTPVEEREAMAINGQSWPHTERLTLREDEAVRWRLLNPTRAPHPMHLHGFYYRVDSRGSWAADTIYEPGLRRLVNTELMPQGGTFAAEWVPRKPGNWIFHCHFPFHVSHHLALSSETSSDAEPGPGEVPHLHSMAGLVLGMHVTPAGEVAEPPPVERRQLRLRVRSEPRREGTLPRMAYVLDDGSGADDALPALGSTLVLERDQPVAITVVNELDEPTAVHWHGIELESFPDGVPGWSGMPGRLMPAIAPGDSFVAEFTPPRAGTFLYHAHTNELDQITAGLHAPLIVLEPGSSLDPERDRVFHLGAALPGGEVPALVNGEAEPPPVELEVGETYRFRLIHIQPEWRVTFALVSDTAYASWRPVAKDGADLPPEQATPRPAFLLAGPGETADFEFTPLAAGDLRLDIATSRSGWHIPVPIRVRERRTAAR